MYKRQVIGFNYGAREYRRVRSGIRFMSVVCVVYTLAAWLVLMLFPQPVSYTHLDVYKRQPLP